MSATLNTTLDLFETELFNDSASFPPLEGFSAADLDAAKAEAEQAKKTARILADFEPDKSPLFNSNLDEAEAIMQGLDGLFNEWEEDLLKFGSSDETTREFINEELARAEEKTNTVSKFECNEIKPSDESVEGGYSINEESLNQSEISTFKSNEQKLRADSGLEELESLESDKPEEKSGFSTNQKIGIGIFIGCAAAVGLTLLFVCPPAGVVAAAVVVAKFLGPAIVAAGHVAIPAIIAAAHVAIPAIIGAAKVAAGAIMGAAGATAGVATAAAGATAGVATTAAGATAGAATAAASTVASTATAAAGLTSLAMTKAAATVMAAPLWAKAALAATAGVAATSAVKKGMQGASSLLSKAVDGIKQSLPSASDKNPALAAETGIVHRAGK